MVRSSYSRKMNKDKGFSLIEIIVSILILAIIVVSILQGFVISARANSSSRQRQYATTLSQDIMETIKNYGLSMATTDAVMNGIVKIQNPSDEHKCEYVIQNYSFGTSKYDVIISYDSSDYYGSGKANEYELPDLSVLNAAETAVIYPDEAFLVVNGTDVDTDASAIFDNSALSNFYDSYKGKQQELYTDLIYTVWQAECERIRLINADGYTAATEDAPYTPIEEPAEPPKLTLVTADQIKDNVKRVLNVNVRYDCIRANVYDSETNSYIANDTYTRTVSADYTYDIITGELEAVIKAGLSSIGTYIEGQTFYASSADDIIDQIVAGVMSGFTTDVYGAFYSDVVFDDLSNLYIIFRPLGKVAARIGNTNSIYLTVTQGTNTDVNGVVTPLTSIPNSAAELNVYIAVQKEGIDSDEFNIPVDGKVSNVYTNVNWTIYGERENAKPIGGSDDKITSSFSNNLYKTLSPEERIYDIIVKVYKQGTVTYDVDSSTVTAADSAISSVGSTIMN